MTAQTLTIEFPATADLPQDVTWDQELLRYGVAGALYVKGLLSREEAERLTGDTGRVFEQKLRELGFHISRSEEPVPGSRSAAASRKKRSRWARVAEFFASEEAGHLNGRSDEALKHLRDFRRQLEL